MTRVAIFLGLIVSFSAHAQDIGNPFAQIATVWERCLVQASQDARDQRLRGNAAAEYALAACESEERLFTTYSLQQGIDPARLALVRVQKKQKLAAAARP